MSRVLFLGAGFSRAFGLPIMAEFFQHAQGSKRLSSEDKVLLTGLQRQARGAAGMVRGTNQDLEHILSLALMSNTFGDGGGAEYVRLQRILATIYGDVEFRGAPIHTEKAFHSLLGFTRDATPPPSTTVITTNYDVLLEMMLARRGFQPQLPFDYVRRSSDKAARTMYATASPITLCKLHGSVNWELDENGVVGVHSGIRVGRQEDPGNWERMLEVVWPEVSTTPLQAPFIVPPSFVKDRPPPFLRSTLAAARTALSQAECVAFIGFSFPMSDNYLKYLIAGALVEHVSLNKIDIIGPQAKTIVAKLKDPSSGYGDHFVDLLNPVDLPWENVVGDGYTLGR